MPNPCVETLGEAFLDYAARAPCALALEGLGPNGATILLTRRELGSLAASYASAFADRGVCFGDRVLLALPNGVDFIAAFWGVQLLGAVAVPAPAPEDGRRFSAMVQHLTSLREAAAPKIMLVQAASRERLDSATTSCLMDTGQIGRHELHRIQAPEPERSSCAVLQFTSGSSGKPRACILSHSAIIQNARAIIGRSGGQAMDTNVVWLPLHHDMGLMSGVVTPVIGGLGAYIQTPNSFLLNPLGWLRKLSSYPRTHTAIPASAMYIIAERLDRRPPATLDLSGVVSIVCGAERIYPALATRFLARLAEYGLKDAALHCAYGMAEATVMATSRPEGPLADRIVASDLWTRKIAAPALNDDDAIEIMSLGRPVVNAAVKILDEAGSPLPERSVGEVHLASGSLMTGYFGAPRDTAEALRSGWLATGDLGYLADGELFVTGRLKDLLIVGGRNLYPADIENAICNYLGLAPQNVLALSRQGTRGTEEIIVLLVVRSADEPVVLRRAAAEACQDYCGIIPSDVLFANPDLIPRTTSGKIRRSEILTLLSRGSLGTSVPASGDRLLNETLAAPVCKVGD